ncbi:unnamed protein product [Dicrocoelium dendriticum]|nr:unnamed protein product [Dicrocoelium dendriticum]
MPVEQAFTLMVQVNNQYGVRELILNDFEGLHMRLYQLQRIIQDQLPDLAKHFTELGLETHMYANQWFLTLFTAKFPLPMVFHIVDLFLTEGMIFIFRVAFCLLRLARRDLLGLDFEGVLKYLRITMPKRFIDTECGSELLSAAVTAKITSSKMLKYAKEWEALKSRGKPPESAVQALERQVATLRREVSRLERENESLASGLISSKTSMHQRVDKLEDKAEVLTRELFASRQDLHDTLEEKAHLESEVIQIKQMLRSTLDQAADERARFQSLLATYRAIATDLVKRHQLSTATHENGGPHTLKCDASQDSSTSTTSLSPDSDALYLRLLWVLIQQSSQCVTCAPVLDAMVSNWRCAESTDMNGTGDAVMELGTQSSPVEPTLEGPVKCSSSQSDRLHDEIPPPESYTPSALRNLKPKQWLTDALTTLRSMASMDNPTGASGNTCPRLSTVRTSAPAVDTTSHPNGC